MSCISGARSRMVVVLLLSCIRFPVGAHVADDCHQTQYLGDAPRLRATTARCVWRLGVEDLADGADTGSRQVLSQALGDGLQLLNSIGVYAAPRVYKWS